MPWHQFFASFSVKSSRIRWILIIIAVLVIIRLILPYLVLQYANQQLSEMKGYYGQVKDIDLSLYRGAYQLDSLFIHKQDSASGELTEFFDVERIDLSIEWRSLFNGHLVGELQFHSPRLIFTKDKAELDEVARDTNDFRKILRDFMPFKVNRFEVEDGTIHYVDETSQPKVDLYLEDAYILAKNLKNTEEQGEELPATAIARAKMCGGSLDLDLKLNALAEYPHFDLNAEIEGAQLPEMNAFFKAYGNFDVSQGTFGLYTELAAADQRFKGYVKPVIKELKVVGLEDQSDSWWQRTKESIVDLAGKILENPSADQVASKIPLEGQFDNPDISTLEAVWELLKNAFVKALQPSIDHEINIQSPVTTEEPEEKKGFFERLFSGSKDEDQKAE